MGRRKISCIFNPKAGEGRFGISESDLEDRIRRIARSAGSEIDLSVHASTSGEDITRLSKEAVADGVDIIAGGGGDGTINEIANVIAETEVALGILPIGSGNDSLTSIKGDTSLEEAILDVISNDPVPMDVGTVNGSYFVNVVGIGLDAEVNFETQRRKKLVRTIGPTLSYLISAVDVILKFNPKRIAVSIDGGEEAEFEATMATIGNGDTCGAGFRLTPKAVMNDGKLDLSLIEKAGRLRALTSISTLYKGKHLGREEVHYHQFENLRIRSLSGEILTQVDGEVRRYNEFHIRVVKNGISILHNFK
ncbi:MAG: diacylglycerol/lipid kinase family protein [Thermoplasmatota archaeon]